MVKVRLSKSSLQQQQTQLKLYQRLLPSLDLKRRQLVVEAQKAKEEYQRAVQSAGSLEAVIGRELPMLADEGIDLTGLVVMTGYEVTEQNVVGTRLPLLKKVEFRVTGYSRFATPAWTDILVQRLKDAAEARVRSRIASERVNVLGQAVKRITQRVNLFEKILIPNAKRSIQRIRIFLGDTERAAVVTSKLAKTKHT